MMASTTRCFLAVGCQRVRKGGENSQDAHRNLAELALHHLMGVVVEECQTWPGVVCETVRERKWSAVLFERSAQGVRRHGASVLRLFGLRDPQSTSSPLGNVQPLCFRLYEAQPP